MVMCAFLKDSGKWWSCSEVLKRVVMCESLLGHLFKAVNCYVVWTGCFIVVYSFKYFLSFEWFS